MENQEASDKISKGLKAVPDLGKLLMRLARDPRVPRKNKLVFLGIAAYLILPFDFIPDWIPGIGQMDDIILVALGLDAMLNQIPHEILEEHWEGDEDVLATIRSILSFATTFVPERIKKKLFTDSTIEQ